RRRSLRRRAASAAAAARASGSIVTGRNGSRSRGRARGLLVPEVEHAGVQERALLERGPHRAVQTVLEVHRPLPPHDVREQVAVEGRVVREQVVEVEGPLGRHELVEAYLRRGDLGPAGRGVEVVLGVRPTVSHTLEDHAASVGRGRAALAGGTPAVRDPVPQSPRGRAAAGGMSPSRRTTAPGRLRYLLAMTRTEAGRSTVARGAALARVAAVAVVVVGLAACSGGASPEDEDVDLSPFTTLMNAELGESQETISQLREHRSQERLAQCVRAAGFEYHPDASDSTVVDVDLDDYEEQLRTQGWGYFTQPEVPEDDEIPEPTEQMKYEQSLSPSAHEEYLRVLFGETDPA